MISQEWKFKFIKLILASEFEGALEIKSAHIPNKLYKYRTVNENSLINLKTDTIWITDPNNYNDPYDSGFFFNHEKVSRKYLQQNIRQAYQYARDNSLSAKELSPSQAELLITIKKHLKNTHPEQENKIEKKVKIFELMNRKQSEAMVMEFNIRMKCSLKMCSFSERNDSMLLWTHYAKDHTGFCVEYDFNTIEKTDTENQMMFPVIYSDDLFDCTEYILSDNNRLNVYFPLIASLHKAKDWQYEEEWRLIFPAGSISSDRNYKISTPTGIYLGSKISHNDKKKVIQIANEKQIPVYNMSLDPYKFKITI